MMPESSSSVPAKPKLILDSDSEDDMPLAKRLKPFVKAPKPADKPVDEDDVPLAQRLKTIEKTNVTNGTNGTSGIAGKAGLLKSKPEVKKATPYDRPTSNPSDTSIVKPQVQPTDEPVDRTKMPVEEKKRSRRGSDDVPLAVKAKEMKAKIVKPADDDDVPLAVKAKKIKKETVAAVQKLKKKSDEDGDGKGEEDSGSQWWDEYHPQDSTVKWTTLEHFGVCFPPEYAPHKVPLIYDGKEIVLEPEAEEVAGFFGALIQTDHAQNEIFVNNFFEDFKSLLRQSGSSYADLIKDFKKCDFSLMHQHFERQKEKKKVMPKDEKERLKAERAALIEKYGYCMIDGRKERIGNFMVEPPGLFRGRGKHPKAGKLKTRVRPEQITINIGKNARVPPPPPGYSWGTVQHENTVTWLATWIENINKAQKYVFLAPESSLKGKSDMEKFEKARKLKSCVKKIRRANAEELRSKEMLVRQRATALWLIDHLALRAGNEKGDDEADTVGCCSLRCEHVKRVEPNILVFDFLGKDSIRYYNEVPVDPIIFKNIGIFMRPPKTPADLIFDRLTTSDLNKYLNGLMPGLTAKVFRTYNASSTFQEELEKTPAEGDVAEKILAYNRANRQVAILCNHQKSVSKNHGQSMDNMRRKVQHIKYQRFLVKKDFKEIMGSKELKAEIPEALEAESDLDDETMVSLQEELDTKEAERKAKKIKDKSEAGEDVSALLDEAKSPSKRSRILSKESLVKKLSNLTTRINATKLQLIDKDENKTTSLGTSKTNYIDPRITVAWCGSHGVPVEKLFTQTLRKKFQWSMNVRNEWKF